MNIICVIQARTTSKRLPNKVLLNLPYGSDETVLEQVIQRVSNSKYIKKIIVATTVNREDDKIQKICSKVFVECYRGSEEDVLSRYYEVATKEKADHIVRITSDCPCVDYEIIDSLIELHIKNNNDFSSNNQIHSFPHGMDCEIVSYQVLKEAFNNSTQKYEREHVMPYIYKSNPQKYKIGNLEDKENNYNIRVTLDTEEDYILLCLVYNFLYEKNKFFNKEEIIRLFRTNKYLYKINQNIEQKKVCITLDEEIEEAKRLLKKQDLNKAYDFIVKNYNNIKS